MKKLIVALAVVFTATQVFADPRDPRNLQVVELEPYPERQFYHEGLPDEYPVCHRAVLEWDHPADAARLYMYKITRNGNLIKYISPFTTTVADRWPEEGATVTYSVEAWYTGPSPWRFSTGLEVSMPLCGETPLTCEDKLEAILSVLLQ